MFKKILQLSLVMVLVVSGISSEDSGEEVEKSDGFCLESKEILFWCTVGTPMGGRLMAAYNTCSIAQEKEEEEVPAGRKEGGGKKCKKGTKCKGKGKGLPAAAEKCPGIEELEAWIIEEHEGKRLSVCDL